MIINDNITEEPTYSLPEVNIYPNNRWGDIARSQGLQTARNWRMAREAVPYGTWAFLNHPITQIATMLLPLPSGFEGTKEAVNMIGKGFKKIMPPVKKAIQTAVDSGKNIINRSASILRNARPYEGVKYSANNTLNGPYGLPKLITNPLSHSVIPSMDPSGTDWVELQRQRYANGGFEKLGIGPDDTYTPHRVKLIDVNGRLYDGNSWINKRKFLNEAKFNFNSFDKGSQNNAYYNAKFNYLAAPTSGEALTANQKNGLVLAHELYHAGDMLSGASDFGALYEAPTVKAAKTYLNIPGTNFESIPSSTREYFSGSNATELHARLAQLKNYFGLKNAYDVITPDMWKYAKEHYIKDIGYDNNMLDMFNIVTDPKKYLDWINPRVATTAGVGGIGLNASLGKTKENDI